MPYFLVMLLGLGCFLLGTRLASARAQAAAEPEPPTPLPTKTVTVVGPAATPEEAAKRKQLADAIVQCRTDINTELGKADGDPAKIERLTKILAMLRAQYQKLVAPATTTVTEPAN
jgi:hypothetical protein